MPGWGTGKGRLEAHPPVSGSLTTRFCTSLLPPVEVSASLTGSRQQAPRQLRSCSSCCTCSRAGLSSSPSRRPWRRLGEKDLEYLELSKRRTGVRAVSLGGAACSTTTRRHSGQDPSLLPILVLGILRCVWLSSFACKLKPFFFWPCPLDRHLYKHPFQS